MKFSLLIIKKLYNVLVYHYDVHSCLPGEEILSDTSND